MLVKHRTHTRCSVINLPGSTVNTWELASLTLIWRPVVRQADLESSRLSPSTCQGYAEGPATSRSGMNPESTRTGQGVQDVSSL